MVLARSCISSVALFIIVYFFTTDYKATVFKKCFLLFKLVQLLQSRNYDAITKPHYQYLYFTIIGPLSFIVYVHFIQARTQIQKNPKLMVAIKKSSEKVRSYE